MKFIVSVRISAHDAYDIGLENVVPLHRRKEFCGI